MSSARHSLLPWIVAFKAFKALTLTVLGVILLGARHRDPADVLMRIALAVHLPLSSRLFDRALKLVLNLTVIKETALGITAFAYAALMSAEGVGLYLRKPWARWFTVGATSSLIPIEIYEIVRELHLVRVIILIANVAIVVYLVQRRELFDKNSGEH